MIILLLAVLLFFSLLVSTKSHARLNLIILSFLFYIFIILSEQLYLENIFNESFHKSDPFTYYALIKKLNFKELISFVSNTEYRSNQFYYILNWLFLHDFRNLTFYAIALKITNLMFFISSYLIFTKKEDKIRFLDIIILFHPFLFFTIIRNVRDFYIIFFLTLFLYIFNKTKINFINLIILIFSFINMNFIRSFFNVLFISFSLIRIYFNLSKISRLIFGSFSLLSFSLIILQLKEQIFRRVISAYISIVQFQFSNGYSEEYSELFQELLSSGSLTSTFIKDFIKKIIVAIPTFLFTPHPYKYTLNFLDQRHNGMWNIYTDVDNIFIILGSIINYLIVIPLFFKYLFSLKKIHYTYTLTAIFTIIIYSIFQLGITDLRIKYTFIFFLIIGFYKAGLNIYNNKNDIIYSFISLIIFIGLTFI